MERPKREAVMAIGMAWCLLTASVAAYLLNDLTGSGSAHKIRQFTGVRTRIVWCQQAKGDGRDVFGRGTELRLMGLDSDDRSGVHPILEATGNYHKPMITPRGDRIVFSDLVARKIFVVNWNGSCLRELADGHAVAVWMNPSDGTEWVYAFEREKQEDEDRGKPLFRFRLNNPHTKEIVWDITPVTTDNLQLSADGKFIGGLFPWPKAGVANLAEGLLRPVGRGCWTSMAPDNSRLLWVFDGAHRNVTMHTADGSRSWAVNVSDAAGVDGHEVYHPRWSNHVRFMCVTGPYRSGKDGNRIRAGGPDVEVYLGRFDEKLASVEKWIRVTHNRLPDFYPDAWIDPAAQGAISRLVQEPGSAGGQAEPGDVERLIVQAKLVEVTAAPSLEAIAPYRQAMVAYAYEVEKVLSGKYEGSRLLVAHWAIRDGKSVAIGKQEGNQYRLELEPYARHPELEGERLVMDISDFRHPLFYDVGKE